MKYPQPNVADIEAEEARLKPHYEVFMREHGEQPDFLQLREWATENVKERIILECEAEADGCTVEVLLKRIAKTVPEVTIAEARDYFRAHPEQFVAPERVHARHIVLHREDYSPADAVTILLNLRNRLLAEELSWKEAVARYSSCAGNDDLGVFPRGVMVEAFEEVAFDAPEGTITDVVETPIGWHLIQVLAHFPEEPMLFEEARESLLKRLHETREREALEAFVDARKVNFPKA